MNPLRRWILAWPAALSVGRDAQAAAQGTTIASRSQPATDAVEDQVRPDRALTFPRDHGAHPGSRIEWWYATGWVMPEKTTRLIGFQLTFFRSRTGLGQGLPGRQSPRQLLFAHAALSELKAGGHRHAQRIGRWNGEFDAALPLATGAARTDTQLRLGAWQLSRSTAAGRSIYRARLAAPEAGFTLALQLQSTQPVLLQGTQGHSLKGPPVAAGEAAHASHYYSQPQLTVQGQIALDGREQAVRAPPSSRLMPIQSHPTAAGGIRAWLHS